MTTQAVERRGSSFLMLEFQELAGLPCGCVAAFYHARPWGVPIVAVEAKGPYCPRDHHSVGEVLELGDTTEESDNAGDGVEQEPTCARRAQE
jgi:hypothetical protein